MRKSDVGVRQLRDLLRSDILHATGKSEQLPDEHELMLEYRTTRSTVREALALLRDEGWVDRVQGIGTVASVPAQGHLVEVNPDLEPERRPPRSEAVTDSPDVLEQSSTPIPQAVAHRLEVTSGDCMRLEYLLRIQGDIAGVVTNYVLYPEAEALLATTFTTDWYDYLESAGITIGKVAFRFGSAGADHCVAGLLDVPIGAPLTLIYQVIRDEHMRPFNFAVMYFRSDRVMFASEGPPGRIRDGPIS